jgi:N-acetylmuramoyl-L-alanine amidase
MLASKVLAEELKNHNKWLNSHEAKPVKQGAVDVFDYKPNGRSDYYYDETTTKNLIVLHHTAGWFWGDLDTLTKSHYHVSVAFVVARSGWIYRLFNPKLWSSHLGTEQNVVGGSVFNGKRSIAIEISNVGQLKEEGSDMTFVHSKYCGANENQYYTKLAQPYRGEKVFATFTDPQYASVSALLDQLCGEFNIPRTFLPVNTRYDVFGSTNAAQAYKGIASHVNFRATGKTDLGPAFEWAKIGA